MRILDIIYVVSCQCLFVESAKILAVFPTPSISHQVVFRPLVQELAKRGHDVTVITTNPAYPKGQAPSNLTEVDVHDISYNMWREHFLGKQTSTNYLEQTETILTLLSKAFEVQLSTSEVQDIIFNKEKKFDLLLLEAIIKPALILSHIFKVPVIHVSSLGGLRYNYELVGAPLHPLLYPALTNQRLYNLTIWEKIHQLYRSWQIENIFARCEKKDNMMLQKYFGQDIPSISELSNNVHMLFINFHPIWTNNQPVPPSVVYINGINKIFPKELPQNLQNILDTSENGVIYFSLGTNVKPSLLPHEKIKMMLKVFSELPFDVIWKWDGDTLPGQSDNIKIFKWLPQPDLLRHPNIKLFITQGGCQSTEEAIHAAVPLIGIPMLADQWYNAEKYVYHGIGIKLDMPSLEENQFKEAIEKVISDKSYRENIKRLRAIITDEPQSAIERAVWWTEYVLRHGGAKHLRAAGANITWTQYLELELVAFIVLFLITILILTYAALKVVLQSITVRAKIKVT